MPLAPEYINGVFNLRGDIVTVINLKNLFALKDQKYSENHKIAVIEFENILMGLAFDSTGEVFRSSTDERYDLSHVDTHLQKVVKGIIKRKDNSKMLQILDTSALAALCHFPQLNLQNSETPPKMKKKQKLLDRRKYVFFKVKDMGMAFDINSIQEVVEESVTKASAFSSNICAGLINLRGQTIPVMDFSRFLGEQKIELTKQCRIIVLKSGAERLGLLVSSVESIGFYTSEQLLHIPMMPSQAPQLYKGCIELQDGHNIFLLNHDEIFLKDEIKELVRGHEQVYPSETPITLTKKMTDFEKQVFVSFRMDDLFALPIKEIKEIINYSEDILKPVGMSDYVKGVLNLRGDLVTIIDTRKLYGIKENTTENPTNNSTAKILILKRLGHHFGLIVDSVSTILSIENSKKVILPEPHTAHYSSLIMQDIVEVVYHKSQVDDPQAVAIMNVESVFSRLSLGRAA